jgi:hypothetical protein
LSLARRTTAATQVSYLECREVLGGPTSPKSSEKGVQVSNEMSSLFVTVARPDDHIMDINTFTNIKAAISISLSV